MKRFTKISLFISTALLTFFAALTGCFEWLVLPYYQLLINYMPTVSSSISFNINAGILMLGICVGIISTIVEKKKKLWFYISVLIIILGNIFIAIFIAHAHPLKLFGEAQIDTLWSFLSYFVSILFYNLFSASLSIITGPTIIIPYFITSNFVLQDFYYIFGFINSYGFKGVILVIGSVHMYFEIYAFFLSSIAGIRVALKSFQSMIGIRKNGIKTSLRNIKDITITEIKNTMPKVIILLMIAALLETLWDPFWTNYWLHHIL